MAVIFTLLSPRAEALDAKMTALAKMASYGTIGGVLLGTASLAFGTGGRSVVKGASIGLYTGILFGSYVVISHRMKRNRANNTAPEQDNYYSDTSDSPYEDDQESGSDDYSDERDNERWQPEWGLDTTGLDRLMNKPKSFGPTFYIPVVNYQF